LRRGSTRFDHFGERRFLEVRRALHGLDEIGNQIHPALINILHLRPGAVGSLRQPDDAIVAAAAGHPTIISSNKPIAIKPPQPKAHFFMTQP
jgi:hypothetical protein